MENGAPARQHPLVRQTLLVRRAVSSVSPAWPLLASVPLLAVILLCTQQGQQGLIAILTERSPPFWATFVALAAHSVLTFGEMLRSLRRNVKFFGQPIRLHRFGRSAALVMSLFLPALTAIFIYHVQGGVTSVDGKIVREAFLISVGVLLFCFVSNYFLGRQLYSVHETALRQVAVMSFRYVRLLRAILIVIGIAGLASAGPLGVVRDAIGPAAILIIALTLIGVILTYFVGLIHDSQGPPLLFWLILLAIVSALIATFIKSRYHDVRLVAAAPAVMTASADSHAKKWIEHRLAGKKPIPAIFVLAEGGGIYAARNAAGYLSGLDILTDGDIYDDIFMMSGVSGGSIGLAAYLAARADDKLQPGEESHSEIIHKFLGGDFLSPLAAGLFFRDIPLRFVPATDLVRWRNLDRASMFEKELSQKWLEACGGACDDRFAEGFLSVVDVARQARVPVDAGPIVAFNTVKIESGRVEIVGNVRFDEVGVSENSSGLYNVLDRLPPDKTLPLSAAAHMSARFPMISPTAMINEQYDFGEHRRLRYVDGGYIDNSGALTALRGLDVLMAAARELDKAKCGGESGDTKCVSSRIKPIVLHFYSRRMGQGNGGERTLRASTNWFEELANPVSGVLRARKTRGAAAPEALCRALAALSETDVAACRNLETDGAAVPESSEEPIKQSRFDDGVAWIDAPLDIGKDARKDSYVPLGWYLGRSNDYILGRHDELTPGVCRRLADEIGDRSKLACRDE